jgi:ribosomal protein S18 acetylase RimI-like enzyme
VTGAELARIVAMQRWVEEATATRVEPWRFGVAVFTDDFPRRYDSNFLRVEKPVGTTTPGELAAEADRLQAHLSHRELIVEDVDAGARLAAGFRELGYVIERLAYMALRTEPSDAPTPALPVREVTPQMLRPTLVAINLAMDGMAPADAEMLADFRPVSAERAGARYFAVELDGVLASYCELYLHEGVAQVEDVNTLERFRNRGAARAVVLAAIAAGRAAGADLVWLLADADDWPQHLYAKLGFEPVGGAWQFTTMAPQHQRMQGATASAP